jgi:hypothetical protein
MSQDKRPDGKDIPSLGEIWMWYGLAFAQFAGYYLIDKQQNIGILFGATFWFIHAKSISIVRQLKLEMRGRNE